MLLRISYPAYALLLNMQVEVNIGLNVDQKPVIEQVDIDIATSNVLHLASR